MPKTTHILKFGGTSLSDVESIQKCVSIIKKKLEAHKLIVVVSAFSGVTDELVALIEFAKKQKPKLIAARLNKLEKRHRQVLESFVEAADIDFVWDDTFAPLFKRLRYILTGVSFVGDVTDKTSAVICSFGERFSSWVMHYALMNSKIMSTRISAVRLIRTDSHYEEAQVDFKRTRDACKRVLVPMLAKRNVVPVITGFIGKDTHGDITLLGRGGSDYTAAIVGAAVGVDAVEIWTDVDGILSANPNLVQGARPWPKIDVNVMAEMAYTGVKVLHPKTIIPAFHNNIPIYIKNTFHPDAPGTEIVRGGTQGLRGIVSKKDQVLLQLNNPKMLDEIGFINNCSQVFVDHSVSIDVCVTSEVSLSCSINKSDGSPKFYKALGKMVDLEIHKDMAKLCIVGHKIGTDAELLSQIFKSMSRYPIYTISNGASFNNITLIVREREVDDILQVLHKQLFT